MNRGRWSARFVSACQFRRCHVLPAGAVVPGRRQSQLGPGQSSRRQLFAVANLSTLFAWAAVSHGNTVSNH